MNPDLELALELADIAAEIAAPRFEDRRFEVTTKPDGSPVTDVDRAVERALREQIARRRPGHAVLGEEYGASGDSEWRWYLDPIDGTSHFVAGEPSWMTFVALAHGPQVTVGVIGMPAQECRWWAARGEGAFGASGRLVVSSTARLADAVVNPDWATGAAADGSPHPPLAALAARSGSVAGDGGRGCASVATGACDVAVALGGHPWDYAAAKVIVEEAGGRFTDLTGADRFDAGAAIATNGRLHAEALAVVQAGAA